MSSRPRVAYYAFLLLLSGLFVPDSEAKPSLQLTNQSTAPVTYTNQLRNELRTFARLKTGRSKYQLQLFDSLSTTVSYDLERGLKTEKTGPVVAAKLSDSNGLICRFFSADETPAELAKQIGDQLEYREERDRNWRRMETRRHASTRKGEFTVGVYGATVSGLPFERPVETMSDSVAIRRVLYTGFQYNHLAWGLSFGWTDWNEVLDSVGNSFEAELAYSPIARGTRWPILFEGVVCGGFGGGPSYYWEKPSGETGEPDSGYTVNEKLFYYSVGGRAKLRIPFKGGGELGVWVGYAYEQYTDQEEFSTGTEQSKVPKAWVQGRPRHLYGDWYRAGVSFSFRRSTRSK